MRLFTHFGFILVLMTICSSVLFSAQEYKGTVVSIGDEQYTTTTGGQDRGFIITLARLGLICVPTVYASLDGSDIQGKDILYPGTPLINGYNLTWVGEYLGQEISVSADKQLVSLDYDNYVRYKKLYNDNAVSQEAFEDMENDLAEGTGGYRTAVDILKEDYQQNIMMVTRARAEGIVSKVTQSAGSDLGGATAIEFVWLNPIGIQVKMPEEIYRNFSPETPIKIYIKGIDKPFGIYNGYAITRKDSMIFLTKNFPVIDKNTILEDNGVPVLREWQGVCNFNIYPSAETILAVPDGAIQKDEKGSFVWRAKGQKLMQMDKGIDTQFQIEKVYVTSADMIRYQTGYTKIVALKDSGKLELNDLVLNNPPDTKFVTLKDRDMVYYPPQAYLMMPGDEVKVVIGDGSIENTK
ncbi:MAG TPA: hypothetical protein DD381_04910 [Lentisphaeria bacterium]|nr:MAG: hypothetical protein A2X47_01820 [Lentisphaerae bacterium GWF2_38_69]HBM15670.1 hypothetical protein [Lentisphaeria bacterium]